MNKKDIKVLGKSLTLLLYILRWATLIMAVVTIGFTIGLITIACLNNADVVNELVAKMMAMFTYYSEKEIIDLIATLGLKKVAIAGISVGVANSISLICEYVMFNNFIKLSKSLTNGEIYTNVNTAILNKTIPYTIVGTFAQPIIIYIANQVTTLLSDSDYDVSGIAYIIIVLVLKIIIDKGYDIRLKEEKNRRELSDVKAMQSELKMELIRKESELRELREFKETQEAKKTVTRKTVKKEKVEEVKEEVKKVSAPKKTTKKVEKVEEPKKTTKKVKKEEVAEKPKKTTKKTETKKVAKKEVAPKKETKTTAKKTTKKTTK